MQIYQFVNNFEIHNFTIGNDIKDIIDLVGTNKSVVISEKDVDDISLESSVFIAAAITSYARKYTAPLLLDDSLDILYTDTDSAKSTVKITELERYQYLNHNNLGGLKYEETMLESIFLSPKLYGGILGDGKEIVKMKGYKDKIKFDILKRILFNNESIILN